MNPPPLKHPRPVWLIVVIVLALMPVLIFAVWRLNLAKKINSRLATLRAAHLPVDCSELNDWYAAVPDADNSALLMIQAFDLMRNFPDSRSKEIEKIKFPRRGKKLADEEILLVADYIEMNRAAVAKAKEAVRLPKTRYPIDFALGAATPFPHLNKLKELGQIVEFQSLLSKDSADATEAIQHILFVAQSLEAEPVLISQLFRIALINMAQIALERRLNASELSETQLSDLAATLSASEKTNLMTTALISERALYIPYFRMNLDELERFSDSEDGQSEPLPPKGEGVPFLKATGFFERDLLFYLQTMERSISLAALPPPQSLAMTNILKDVLIPAKSRFYLLSGMLLPALGKVTVKEASAFAVIRVARAALAVEQFKLEEKKLPADLEILSPRFLKNVPADPFDGKPLRYRRLENGYVIYSVGSDGQDNGGLEKPANQKSTEKTPFDITFTVER